MLHARASIEESLIYLESIPKTGLIATVREKSGKTENFSRSGKSQGIFKKSGKIFAIVKVSEKSGNSVFWFIHVVHKCSSRF